MAKDAGKKRRRRPGKKGRYYLAVIVVIMLGAVAAGLGTFFLVSDIEVRGADIYGAEEIVCASGVELGKSIFFLDTSGVKEKLMSGFAYVEDVSVSRKLPGTVVINVTESFPVGWIRAGEACWIIDKNGRLLEKTDYAGPEGLMEVIGAEPIQPVAGSTMALPQEDGMKLEYLKRILSGLYDADMAKNVTRLDVSSVSSISFDYLGRFTILMGRGENVEDKLALLEGVVGRLEPADEGRIDLSVDGRASFLPG